MTSDQSDLISKFVNEIRKGSVQEPEGMRRERLKNWNSQVAKFRSMRKPRHSLFLFQLRLRIRFIDCHVAFKTDQIILFGSSKTMVRVAIPFKVTKSYAKWLCINRFNLALRILLPWNVFPSEMTDCTWWVFKIIRKGS